MIFHRGREMAHQDVGRAKMDRLLKEIMDHAQVEFGPRMEANILLALLAPKKGAVRRRPAAHRRRKTRMGQALRKFSLRGNREEEQENEAKTHRGAAKRFKITSTGKMMRWHSGKRHLLGTKKPRRMRRLANTV